MMLSDPAGLLQRMPELERIAIEDGPVRAGLASGDPFKLYRALRWGSWTGRLKAHQELVTELLNNRRLFARPIKTSPGLGTLNSLGVSFVGEDEVHPDGTYITGHYLVIFFKLPLLPLGAYLVAPGPNTNSYRIFARVPLGSFTWAWSRAAALATAFLVASAAWGAFQNSRFATVHVANGFKKPLAVEIAGIKATVAPNTTQTLTVPVGEQPARAQLDGAVVDEGPINVLSGQDAFVWNVGGVSPLYKIDIDYYAVEPAWPTTPRFTFFCGHRVIAERNVDFVFRQPDKTVSMSKGTNVVTRVMITADWKAPDEPGRNPCLSLLYLRGDPKGLQQVSDSLAAADELAPGDESLPIVTALLAGADDGVWDRAKTLHARRPDDVESERTVIWAAEETGHLDELVAELKARQEKDPDDADAAYLALRADPHPPSLSEVEALLLKFPEHEGLLHAAQMVAVREGQWARSLAVWKQRLRADPSSACEDAELATRAGVAVHREDEVLQQLEDCQPPGGEIRFETVLAATRLAMARQKDPEPWVARLDSEPARQRLRLLAGLPVKDIAHTRLEPIARFLTAVHKSGDAVFAELPNLPGEELQTMDSELAALVWAEAVRRGNSAAATLARRTRLTAPERKALAGFVTGADKELEAKRFQPLVRAIAYLTRSRADGVAPAEKERLQKLVRQEAGLSGFVLSSLDHWP